MINTITETAIRQKAIAVRERIVDLYKSGEYPEMLTQHFNDPIIYPTPTKNTIELSWSHQKNALKIQKHSSI